MPRKSETKNITVKKEDISEEIAGLIITVQRALEDAGHRVSKSRVVGLILLATEIETAPSRKQFLQKWVKLYSAEMGEPA